jgi:hypothetical protein
LTKQFIVDQNARRLGGKQVRTPARRGTQFHGPASKRVGNLKDRIVLRNFAVLQLRHPNLIHSFGLQQQNVFVRELMALRQQLLAAWTKNGAAQNAPFRILNFDCQRSHDGF